MKIARLFGRIVRTRPENNTEKHASGALERVKLTANYIRLVRAPQWQISKYHATFEPDCPCARTRNFLIGQYKSVLGGYLFDGTQLFLARQIQTDNGVHKFQATLPRENITYEIRLQFTKVVEMTEDESYQVLNLILRRATAALKLELVNRNYFDPKAAVVRIFAFQDENKADFRLLISFSLLATYSWTWSEVSAYSCGLATKHRFENMKPIFC